MPIETVAIKSFTMTPLAMVVTEISLLVPLNGRARPFLGIWGSRALGAGVTTEEPLKVGP